MRRSACSVSKPHPAQLYFRAQPTAPSSRMTLALRLLNDAIRYIETALQKGHREDLQIQAISDALAAQRLDKCTCDNNSTRAAGAGTDPSVTQPDTGHYGLIRQITDKEHNLAAFAGRFRRKTDCGGRNTDVSPWGKHSPGYLRRLVPAGRQWIRSSCSAFGNTALWHPQWLPAMANSNFSSFCGGLLTFRKLALAPSKQRSSTGGSPPAIKAAFQSSVHIRQI